jgi:hypothetical protein
MYCTVRVQNKAFSTENSTNGAFVRSGALGTLDVRGAYLSRLELLGAGLPLATMLIVLALKIPLPEVEPRHGLRSR